MLYVLQMLTWSLATSFRKWLCGRLRKLPQATSGILKILRKCVEENAHSALDQAEYDERYKALAKRYESIKGGLEAINEKRL